MRYLLISIVITTLLQGENRQQIAYLARTHALKNALELYEKTKTSTSKHDFEILEQIGQIILEEGAHSADSEAQLLTLFGLGYAGVASSVDIINILERGIKTNSMQTQLYCIQFLGQLQDDRSEILLTKAMASDFLLIRLEAAHQLSLRKERSALGQIETLMQKLPHPFRVYFPEFFLRIGTPEATNILRQFLNDRDPQIRIATLLNLAMHGRDDLIGTIRNKATSGIDPEKEAALSALGFLKDRHSIPLLQKSAESSSLQIRLAALRSLHLLGETSVREKLLEQGSQKDPFAIALLADVSESEELLASLVNDDNLQVRFNAALALLKHKDPRCFSIIREILIRDTRDLGFQPQFSSGASLQAIKVIPSAKQHHREEYYDLITITISVREQILRESLELPEPVFLKLAASIFASGQTELIPVLISLLESLETPQALALLKEQTQRAGSPLVRNYCNLALFRLRTEGPYEERLYEWIKSKKKNEIIQFRALSARMPHRKESTFELTPEENSRLLIESYAALADRHDDKSLDALLMILKEGTEKNRPLIAGFLLRAIQ